MIYQILQAPSLGIVERAPEIVINIIIALIILLIGFMAGKLVGSLLSKLFTEMQLDKGFSKVRKQSFSIGKALAGLASLIIYIVTVLLALNHLHIIDAVLIGIVALILLFIFGSILLSLLSAVPKLYFGIRLLLTRPFNMGDRIRSRSVFGNVVRIGLLSCTLEGASSERLIVPNSFFYRERFTKVK